ncbi:MAG: redoxin domain-containing protein [Proteobacteria bacterium]|nr:redoxin domain-containing protein [Pseudomonadota bacterium]
MILSCPGQGAHSPGSLRRRRYRLPGLLYLLCLGVALLFAQPALAQPSLARVGDPAPSFSLPTIDGRKVSLSDFRGKYVVLEWWNSDCFAINTHYGAGAMQAAQRRARASGTIWLSIDSTHPAHPSFVDAKRSGAMLRQWKANQTAMLQDPDGQTGRAYGAMVTPHTYVIDPSGTLIYAGAIDDQRTMRDVRKASNLALAAIEEARAGKPVSRPLTQAYG